MNLPLRGPWAFHRTSVWLATEMSVLKFNAVKCVYSANYFLPDSIDHVKCLEASDGADSLDLPRTLVTSSLRAHAEIEMRGILNERYPKRDALETSYEVW